MNTSLEKDILHQLNILGIEQQRQVLNFARALATNKPVGIAGKELLRFGGTIELQDLNEMSQAIEEGCEQVNSDEW